MVGRASDDRESGLDGCTLDRAVFSILAAPRGDPALTTIIPFTPSIAPGSPPFQFNATFDGTVYACSVRWNVYAQRYYVLVSALDGPVIVNQALVGSLNAKLLSSLSWSDRNGGTVEAVTAAPHNMPLGQVAELTITGAVPSGLNGAFRCAVDSPSSFYYPLSADPGNITLAGNYEYDVNLVGGYFASTLIWRVQNNWFEVSP